MAALTTSSDLKPILDSVNNSLFKRLTHLRQTRQLPLAKDWALLAFIVNAKRGPLEKGGYLHIYRYDRRVIFGQHTNCIHWIICGGFKNKFKHSEILWTSVDDPEDWVNHLFKPALAPLLRTSPTYRIAHSKLPLYGLLPTAT